MKKQVIPFLVLAMLFLPFIAAQSAPPALPPPPPPDDGGDAQDTTTQEDTAMQQETQPQAEPSQQETEDSQGAWFYIGYTLLFIGLILLVFFIWHAFRDSTKQES